MIGALVAVAFVLPAGLAVAGGMVSLGVAQRTVGGQSATIVVDGRGVTVYELGGESLAHLQCLTRACLNTWPPLKVSSATSRVQKAGRVPGAVSIMHRVKGRFYQVMLDRHPLYYYSGDHGASGSTKGQGITSYGGTWHVVGGSG